MTKLNPSEPNETPHEASLQQDFNKAFPPFIIYLGTIIILISFSKDLVRVGFNLHWLLIRIGYLPFVLIVWKIAKKKLQSGFYELPLLAAGLYITCFCTFFSFSTGGLKSDYIFGLLQLYFAIALMPITAITFYTTAFFSIGIYVGTNIYVLGFSNLPDKATSSTFIPLMVFSVVVYIINSKIRKSKLDIQKKLYLTIKQRNDVISKQSKKIASIETKVALGALAAQVVHDIRSPLCVLNIETKNLALLPEQNRINIRNAIQRVNDIANNLLYKYKQEKDDHISKTIPSPELVSVMLETIVSEKRIQILNNDIQIALEISASAYKVFINVDIVGFQRALSNIINNSIEAIESNGRIIVKLTNDSKKVFIKITDNGKGITKDKLPLICLEGTSFGKKNGYGLGLPYVINKLSSWNGDYSFTSEVGEGTEFEMIIPQVKPAERFAQEINITENYTIIILDDDDYIHNIWDNRFTLEVIKAYQLTLHHFYEPDELIEFCRNKNLQNMCFLLDYELIGHQKNGLMLAEILSIGKRSILVTSRYGDPDVRETCRKLNMKIMPKPFAERTPINFLSFANIVFIDDEEIMTQVWQESAIRAGIEINVFNDPHEFMRVHHLYQKNTLIYMDSTLGGNWKGEDFAKTLFDKGYQNIILATGYPKEKFKGVSWVKDIVGKEPPWN